MPWILHLLGRNEIKNALMKRHLELTETKKIHSTALNSDFSHHCYQKFVGLKKSELKFQLFKYINIYMTGESNDEYKSAVMEQMG